MKYVFILSAAFLIGCGGGSSGTRTNPTSTRTESYYQTVRDGERIPSTDGQVVSVDGNNNNVEAIVAEDGSTVVYCKSGSTCNVIINSDVNNNTGGQVNEDLSEDLAEDL